MSITRLASARRVSVSALGGPHVEAMDWASRVVTNGGSVSASTLRAVSAFCVAVDAAGIRDRFLRLNLFCGTGLSAALVPLYRSASFGGTTYGNTTDTNNNFVSGDYNDTGAVSGLTGNGTSKYLNTGVNANAVSATDCHLGVGLASAATGTAALRVPFGAFNNSSNALLVYGFDQAGNGTTENRRVAYFSRFGTLTDGCGPLVNAIAAAPGRIVAAYPTCFFGGAAHFNAASTSQNYPSAHSMYVFALNNSNTSVLGYFNGRINWYSFGLTMTASQVMAFDSALAALSTTLSRT
jgi:hypothetical protein